MAAGLNIPQLYGAGQQSAGQAQGLSVPQVFPPGGAPQGLDSLAQQAIPKPAPHGPLGFLVNLGRDAVGMVEGIARLGGYVLHDAAKGLSDVVDAVTPGRFGMGGGYYLDDIAKGFLPALKHDYAERYGSLSKFGKGVYEHPLAFALDALTIAAAPSAAAEIAAKVGYSGKLAEIGEASRAAEFARTLGSPEAVAEAENRIRLAQEALPDWINKTHPNVQPGAGIGTPYPAGYTTELRGNEAARIPLATNPLKRAAQKGIESLFTEPIGVLQDRLGAARSLAAGERTPEVAMLEHRLQTATEQGVSRLARPTYERFNYRRIVNQVVGLRASHFLQQREQYTKLVEDLYRGVHPADMEKLYLQYQGIYGPVGEQLFKINDARAEVFRQANERAVAKTKGLIETIKDPELKRYAGDVAEAKFTDGPLPDVTGYKVNARQAEKLRVRVGSVVVAYGYNPSVAAVARGTAEVSAEDAGKVGAIRAVLDGTASQEQRTLTATIPPSERATLLEPQLPENLRQIEPISWGAGSSSRGFDLPVEAGDAQIRVEDMPHPTAPPPEVDAIRTVLQQKVENALGPGTWRQLRSVDPEQFDYFLGNSQAQAILDVSVPTWNEIPGSLDKLRGVLGEPTGNVVNHAKYVHDLGYRGVTADFMTPEGNIIQARFQTPAHAIIAEVFRNSLGPTLKSQEDELAASVARVEELNGTIDELQSQLGTPGVLSKEQLTEVSKNLGDALGEIDNLNARIPLMQDRIERSKWLARHWFHPAVNELEEQVNGRTISQATKLADSQRTLNIQWSEGPEIKTGGLDPVDAFNRSFLGQRMLTGGKIGKDGLWEGGLDALQLNAINELEGLPPPIYFPHYDMSTASRADFLMSRQRVGMRRYAPAKFLRQNRGKLFEAGDYIKDPASVYVRRVSQALRHYEAYDFAKQIIRQFSRPIRDQYDYVHGAEQLLAPDGLDRWFKAKIFLQDAIYRGLGAAKDDEAVGEALDTLMPYLKDKVAANLLGRTTKGLNLYAIPKVVADQLDAFVRPVFGDNARLFWDTPTKWWRGAVLLASPRWVLNNLVGNIIFLKLQGGSVTNALKNLLPGYHKMLEELLPDAVNSGFWGTNEQYYLGRLGKAGEGSKFAEAIDRLQDTPVHRFTVKWGEFIRRANAYVEDAFRGESFLTEAERQAELEGVKRNLRLFGRSRQDLVSLSHSGILGDLNETKGYVTGPLAEKAGKGAEQVQRYIDRMNYWMNDYRKMGPIARKYVRRFIFPFWGFYRHVWKLTLSMPLTIPARLDVLRTLESADSELRQEMGPLPPWMKNDVPLEAGTPLGPESKWITTGGFDPFNMVDAGLSGVVTALHPIPKTILEAATGKDVFGRDFTAPNVIAPFGSDQKYAIRVVNGQPQAEPIERVTPNPLELVLRNFPQYQFLENVLAGGSSYTASGLPSIAQARADEFLTGAPPAGGPIFTAPGETGGGTLFPVSPIERTLSYLGLSTRAYNVPGFQTRLQSEQAKAVLQYLRRIGLVPPAGSPQQAPGPWIPSFGGAGQ